MNFLKNECDVALPSCIKSQLTRYAPLYQISADTLRTVHRRVSNMKSQLTVTLTLTLTLTLIDRVYDRKVQDRAES